MRYAIEDMVIGGYYTEHATKRVDKIEDAVIYDRWDWANARLVGLEKGDARVIEVDECYECGELRNVADLQSICTEQATHWDPPAYDDICQQCLDKEAAAEAYYWDRKIDEARGK